MDRNFAAEGDRQMAQDIPRLGSYADICRTFRWDIPAVYNIVEDACLRWARAQPDRLAVVDLRSDGSRREWTYGALASASARLASLLVEDGGLRQGDRCAILLPQCVETVLSHFALYRIGAVAVPMFTLFGEDAVAYRTADSGARVAITNSENASKLAGVESLRRRYLFDEGVASDPAGFRALAPRLQRASDRFGAARLSADAPAFISYTSGTTGAPKGALHAHRVLLGHLPGVQLPHEFFPQAGDCMWTPADWAWLGGLANVMLPSLRCGVPLVAWRTGKFDPEAALAMMERESVRNSFMPPTALRMIRQAVPNGAVAPRLRSVASGGEALGADTLEWGRQAFGLTVNEFYGQTECNLVVGSCASLFPPKPGSTGRPLPGHRVAALRADGTQASAGETGEIAIRRPDPSMFLEYFGRPDATREKFIGDCWLRTGDLGMVDEDGHVHFQARKDDVITSSGYRIGPSEIENCLAGHPDVALAGVIGVPDALRTEAVVAFVELADAERDRPELRAALRQRVRERVGAHAAPREVRVVDRLPLTATGKIMRRSLRERFREEGALPPGADGRTET